MLIGEICRGSRNNSTSYISLVYFHWPCFIAWKAVAGILYKNKKVNPIFIHQASLLTLSLCVFLLRFASNYWSLVLFSIVYGLSDGVFITGSLYIPMSCVDSKRKTAAFCTSCFFYSLGAVSGSPIAGEL